jgi:hypothetical protein
MLEALRSVPEQDDAPQSLAELSAIIPKRADDPSVITELDDDEPTAREPTLRTPMPSRPHEDDAPLPVPAVILPSTPDGKPPVLSPFTGPPPPGRATPVPPPMGSEPVRRPSGRIHIANGTSRDVIDTPIPSRAEPETDRGLDDAVTKPSLGPFRPSGERREPPSTEPVTRPNPPVLHRFDEPATTDDTVRTPTAPRAMADRARRSGTVWAALLGLAIGAAVAFQVAAPAKLTALFPPTAASEVRAGAQAARQGDVDGALAHFLRASELDPKSAPAWRNLGVVYALKGDQVSSTEAYRKYLELEQDPEQARAVRSLLGEK